MYEFKLERKECERKYSELGKPDPEFNALTDFIYHGSCMA
jgi:hypothetical protein